MPRKAQIDTQGAIQRIIIPNRLRMSAQVCG